MKKKEILLNEVNVKPGEKTKTEQTAKLRIVWILQRTILTAKVCGAQT